MKPLDSSSKMMPPSRIVLLTLCAILTGTELASGFLIRKPVGKCPPVPPGIRCAPMDNQCEDSNDCKWNEKCCDNGCGKVCMSSGLSSVTTKPPFFRPPPYKPPFPFPYDPPEPIPERPHLPPMWFPPKNPNPYEPDDDLLPPIIPRYDDFP